MESDEYLDSPDREQADAWGDNVDSNDGLAPEYEQVILPEMASVAKQRAWHTVCAIK